MSFNLSDFTKDLEQMAQNNKCSFNQAVEDFVVNLTVMRAHYPGADQLNFHQLGQQWNKLTSKDKVQQKTAMLNRTFSPEVTKKSQRRNRSEDL